MISDPNGTDEEKESHFVTESPDQLSMAERTEDEEDEDGEAVVHRNGHYGFNGKVREASGSEGDRDEEEDGVGYVKRRAHDTEEDEGEYAEEQDDDEDEDDEDDEDYDEDDDDEPALKYERLGGSVHDLLQKDSASALAHSHQRLVRHCFLP